MAIFGSNNNYDDLDTLVCEGYDAEVNGSVDAIIESYDDQLAIMEAIHKMDMEELDLKKEGKDDEEIGELLEGSMSDTWKKIKEAFVNLFAKIRAWIDSAIRYFDSHFKSTEAFLDKYEKELTKLNLTGYKYEMFNYTNMNVVSELVKSKPRMALKEMDEYINIEFENVKKGTEVVDRTKLNEMHDEIRGAIVGKSKLDASEYSKELYKFFRNGASDASDKKELAINITSIIAELRAAAKFIPALKDVKKEQDAYEKKMISRIKSAEAEALRELKNDKATSDRITAVARESVYATQSAVTISTTLINAAKTVCSEIVSTYTAVCRGAFTYAKKSK